MILRYRGCLNHEIVLEVEHVGVTENYTNTEHYNICERSAKNVFSIERVDIITLNFWTLPFVSKYPQFLEKNNLCGCNKW